MNRYWSKYPTLNIELNKVKEVIKNSIKSSESYIEEQLLPMIEPGGKMLRPAFLLLSAKFGEYDEEKLFKLAAAIEMLHMATLIHDDIIDDSFLRRGEETIQSKYGKDYAVFLGDYLLSRCIILLSDKREYKNIDNIANKLTLLCLGEIKQYYLRYKTNITLRNYLKIISGKTAALFSLSFNIGASEAKCDDKLINNLTKIGYYIGMAFQIIDDILDYTGDGKILGKNIKADLKQGFYTLPLIFALNDDKSSKISNIISNAPITDKNVSEIVRLVTNSNGINKSRKLAKRYTEKAFKYIDKLPNCESKSVLLEVTQELLDRNF